MCHKWETMFLTVMTQLRSDEVMKICGTCKSWKYDTHFIDIRVGQCRNGKVLYKCINPFPCADDINPVSVSRYETDSCEEWEDANLS